MQTNTVTTPTTTGGAPAAVPAPVVQAAAAAQASEFELKTIDLTGTGSSIRDKEQLVALPELVSLKAGRSLSGRLREEQRKVAEDFASRQKLDDHLEITKIGAAQQDDSKKVIKMTGKLIREDAKIVELGEVGELANELKTKMVALGVGNLEEKWYHKAVRAIPIVGERVDRLGTFIARYEKITTRLEEIMRAMSDEKVELEDLHARAGKVVKVNQQALENLTVAAAAVEIMLKKKEAEFKKEAERYRKMDTLEDEDLEHITEMRQTLSALDRKLVTLKVQRTETRKSIGMMRDLMDAVVEARSMLDDQLTLQESIWSNQINNAILEHKVRGVNAMIRNSRDFTNRLIQLNQQNVSATITELKQLAGEPGVDLAVLKASVEAQKALHEHMLTASVENRKKLNAASAALDEIDKQMGEDGKDLPTLLRMLDEDEADSVAMPN